jgi:hypothetical protein
MVCAGNERMKLAPRPRLKVTRAAVIVPDARTLRLLILKREMTLRADAQWLRMAGAAAQLDVADGPVAAQMAGDGKVVDSADGG